MNRILIKLFLLALLLFLPISGIGCRRQDDNLDLGVDISRSEIMFAHNKERMKAGSSPLEHDAFLEERAQKWAEWMAQRDSLTHSHLSMGGTNFMTMGENIAMGYPDIDSVVDGWMNSSGHKRNILNKKFTHAGYGYAKKPNGSAYWCAQFGGR
jgi:uncharacterized protein YkwD